MKVIGKVTIDKGIPIPTCRRNGIYPWREMEVGDSFMPRTSNLGTVSSMITYRHQKHGPARFAYRIDAKTKKIRVWRVK